ncbi:outer membrane lipoprotein-sorting protein [Gammaproteobacteria bacterium 42_54_T18]|nr:outer membrane lipoprotein-sorting protein [Gammaproteobacteria bacterium 42_54_T18]
MEISKTKRITKTLATTALLLIANVSIALTTQEQGLAISKEHKQRDVGWTDSTADMLMLLKNEQGQQSTRDVKIRSLEQQGKGDKSLSIFNKPRDVRGTAFLSFSHPVEPDDQWMYLPVLKRVKRISSKNKSGPFMGSEFSFEDLGSFEIAKYTYNYLGDDNIHGVDSFMVEQFPVDENSGYTRRIVWIDKQEYLTQKIDFYDRKNSLLKTLSYRDYQQYLDRFWRANSMKMINHQSGKSTVLQWNNYAFRTGLKDSDFNRNSLKRAR